MKNSIYIRAKKIEPYLYLLPAALFLIVLMVYPLIQSLFISFMEWDGLGEQTFVGIDNYITLLSDSNFWNSMRITLIWVLMSMTLPTIGGMILALLVHFGTKSKWIEGVNRTVLFLPMTLSLVAVGLMFTLIYNPMFGLLNDLLSAMGLNTNLDLLGSRKTALYALFFTALWQWSGFGMVIIAAALQGIPGELSEAASIDGASKLQQIRRIFVPLLMPTAYMIAIIHMIGGFKAFDLIYVMTRGGPAQATEVTSVYFYRQAFILHKFGYSSAIAFVLFLVILLFTYIFMRKAFRLR